MSLVGRHIGRYRILETLGQGGMSVVYKGLDTALDREVAVKVLHPHLSGKLESRKRLAREAKAVAKLHHPNILEVFDFAAADSEDAYIVTEYIRGQTLRQFAGTHTFDPPEVAAMVIHEIASALAHAHEAGIIHRDLKPENVMVREDGVLKLMDFGIAKMIDRDEKMTVTGALVGSPAHMAPEIIEGEDAGPEADIFSLGTMLYAFATHRLPFVAANTTATLKRVLDGVYEDPRALVPSLSDELTEVIATCLMRQPTARYANAGLLRDALAAYLSEVGLNHIGDELVSFFADPPSYRKQMVPRLTGALIARSERQLAEKRPAKALSGLNQVLALDGTHPRALALLQQMNRSRRRQQTIARWLKGAFTAALLIALTAAGNKAYERYSRVLDLPPPPVLKSASAVPVPAASYPKPAPPPTSPAGKAAPVLVTALKVEETHAPRALRTVSVGRLYPVEVVIRPFGNVQVDSGERTKELSKTFNLSLPAGRHRLTVFCDDRCDPVREEVEVAPWTPAHPDDARNPNHFAFAVRLKPGRLQFDYEPREALVRIVGGEERSARGTLSQPFIIRTSREKTRALVHQVAYEISLPGYKTQTGTAEIEPLTSKVIAGKLEAE